jgi:hypothetical protein
LSDERQLAKALGPHWWFHFGKALCEVIMPTDFYKIGPPHSRHFDDVGLRALEKDWAGWRGEPSGDTVARSRFNLFYQVGVHLFGKHSREAMDYAMYFMERRKRVVPIMKSASPQRHFEFQVGD